MWRILHVRLGGRWGKWGSLWRGKPSRTHWRLEKVTVAGKESNASHMGGGEVMLLVECESPSQSWVIWAHGKHPVNDIIRPVWINREFKSWKGTFPHLCVWAHRHTSLEKARVMGQNLSPLDHPTLQMNQGEKYKSASESNWQEWSLRTQHNYKFYRLH